MYKVEIFQKNETFLDDLVEFIFEKSPSLKRDNFIDDILNKSDSVNKNYDYIKKIGRIELDNVFGSTFQSSYRSNDNIYAISHIIKYLEFENDSIHGIIEHSQYGELLDFEKDILMPVYFKEREDSKFKIATFDIDFNIIRNVA